MTDRELLEAAAKAYGDPHVQPGQPEFTRWIGRNEDIGCDVLVRWNPLTDDGDALRLAVRLRLDVSFIGGSVEVCGLDNQTGETRFIAESIDDAQDEGEATRRAIVRAAAAIGGAA